MLEAILLSNKGGRHNPKNRQTVLEDKTTAQERETNSKNFPYRKCYRLEPMLFQKLQRCLQWLNFAQVEADDGFGSFAADPRQPNPAGRDRKPLKADTI
jgi:hypothetical protein